MHVVRHQVDMRSVEERARAALEALLREYGQVLPRFIRTAAPRELTEQAAALRTHLCALHQEWFVSMGPRRIDHTSPTHRKRR